MRKSDPIPLLAAYLRAHGLMDDAKDSALVAAAKARVASAYAFARNSPDPLPEDALLHVFA